jgi:23S rRNA (adenine2030-N6)-methyltransferase
MDYDHRHHVGNRADVWKHTVLLAVLAALKQVTVHYAETHAGRGRYTPVGGGEWTRGVEPLLAADTGNGAVDRYLARVRKHLPLLAGSPLLAAGSLGRRDTLTLHETAPQAVEGLRATFAPDPRARVVATDGWALALSRPADGVRNVVLVDPPYSSLDDWAAAGDAVVRLHAEDRQAVLLLWSPVKRWTRPNGLRARLREAGLAPVHLDLTWARLEGREELGGSAMTLVNAPPTAVAECVAGGVSLGPRLSIDGTWTTRAEQQGGAA